MLDLLNNLGAFNSLALGLALGALLAALLTATWLQRRQQAAKDEATRLKRSLRHTQVQLDQARKNAEALEVEVLEWRRRSSLRSTRASSNSRFVSSAPPQAEAWVLGALLDGDGDRASGFADTQILPGAAH